MKARNIKRHCLSAHGLILMRDFDALPPPLRQWLNQSRLPWSARSALKI